MIRAAAYPELENLAVWIEIGRILHFVGADFFVGIQSGKCKKLMQLIYIVVISETFATILNLLIRLEVLSSLTFAVFSMLEV
jgi:hypothetical protein